MKIRRLTYSIMAEVVFTGQELEILRICSRAHYDYACKNMFIPGPMGFGAEWRLVWRGAHDQTPDELPDETIRVEVDSSQADRCIKVLGGAHGLALPMKVVMALTLSLRQTLETLNQEYRRLNPPDPDPEDVSSP